MTAALSSRFLKQAEDAASLKSTASPACAHKDLPQEQPLVTVLVYLNQKHLSEFERS